MYRCGNQGVINYGPYMIFRLYSSTNGGYVLVTSVVA